VENLYLKCSEILGNSNFCIAGGAIVSHLLSTEPSDTDCFFTNETYYNQAIGHIEYRAKLIKKRAKSRQYELENGMRIDVIFVSKDSYREVIECFDLVHCCHYYTPKEGIVSLENAESYTRLQLIHLKTITLPYLTLGRIAKAKTRGFCIDSNQENLILQYCYKAPWGPSKESEYLMDAP